MIPCLEVPAKFLTTQNKTQGEESGIMICLGYECHEVENPGSLGQLTSKMH